MKIGCSMQYPTRRVLKNGCTMGKTVNNDVFQPFFGRSKTKNHVLSPFDEYANSLTTPYVKENNPI